MKKTLLALFIGISTISTAQTDQMEAIANNGGGSPLNYVATKEGANYKYEYSQFKPSFRLEPFHEFDQTMVYYKNENIPSEELFVPAEDAFVVTMVRARYKGNDSIINVTHGMEYFPEDRLVFIDEYIYYLKDWKSKNEYTIKYVFKKGELSKMQAAKEVFAADKKMQEAGVTEKLAQYLQDGFAKQEQLLPNWEQDNPDMVGRRERNTKYASALIQAKNNAFWSSPEGQAQLQRMREDSNQPKKYTVVNTGKTSIDVGINGSTKHLNPGDKWELSCINDLYYAVLDGTTWKRTSLIVKGKEACGRTIEL